MSNTVRILVADANYLVRHGLKYIIESSDNLELAGETEDLDKLISDIAKLRPNVILMGLNTDATSSLDIIEEVLTTFPNKKILVIDNVEDKIKTVKILQSGVHGYILRSCDREEILDAIHSMMKGKNFFCSNVIKVERDIESGKLSKLSDREVEVLRLISQGMTNNEIAEQIFLSSHTVATHRKNLMKKLKAKNNVDLVISAIKESIIQPV